jgi:hypothetical protein
MLFNRRGEGFLMWGSNLALAPNQGDGARREVMLANLASQEREAFGKDCSPKS